MSSHFPMLATDEASYLSGATRSGDRREADFVKATFHET